MKNLISKGKLHWLVLAMLWWGNFQPENMLISYPLMLLFLFWGCLWELWDIIKKYIKFPWR